MSAAGGLGSGLGIKVRNESHSVPVGMETLLSQPLVPPSRPSPHPTPTLSREEHLKPAALQGPFKTLPENSRNLRLGVVLAFGMKQQKYQGGRESFCSPFLPQSLPSFSLPPPLPPSHLSISSLLSSSLPGVEPRDLQPSTPVLRWPGCLCMSVSVCVCLCVCPS